MSPDVASEPWKSCTKVVCPFTVWLAALAPGQCIHSLISDAYHCRTRCSSLSTLRSMGCHTCQVRQLHANKGSRLALPAAFAGNEFSNCCSVGTGVYIVCHLPALLGPSSVLHPALLFTAGLVLGACTILAILVSIIYAMHTNGCSTGTCALPDSALCSIALACYACAHVLLYLKHHNIRCILLLISITVLQLWHELHYWCNVVSCHHEPLLTASVCTNAGWPAVSCNQDIPAATSAASCHRHTCQAIKQCF